MHLCYYLYFLTPLYWPPHTAKAFPSTNPPSFLCDPLHSARVPLVLFLELLPHPHGSFLLLWFLTLLQVTCTYLKLRNEDPQSRKNTLFVLLVLDYLTQSSIFYFYPFKCQSRDFIFLSG